MSLEQGPRVEPGGLGFRRDSSMPGEPRARTSGEKPYVVQLTADDAYEQDRLQFALATSPLEHHRQVAKAMARTFSAEPHADAPKRPAMPGVTEKVFRA